MTAAAIQTVTGPIDPLDLGVTLVHEHVLIDMYEVSLNSLLILSDESLAKDELAIFREAGGGTIVDQTVIGLNPDPDALRRISLATGVRIVAGTGVYWRRFRPGWVDALSVDEVAARFDERPDDGHRGKVLSGPASSVKWPQGIAISTRWNGVSCRPPRWHTHGPVSPIATHAIFTGGSASSSSTCSRPLAPIRRTSPSGMRTRTRTPPTMRRSWRVVPGSAFDTTGQLDKVTDEWRADRIVALAGQGYLERLLVSSDVCKRPALVRNGGGGYAHVLRTFVPLLLERGFGQAEVDVLLRSTTHAAS